MTLSLRHLVLDFDGVIADGTNRAYIDTYADAIGSVGGRCSPAEIEAGILRHWGESPRRELAGVMGETHPGLDAALHCYQAHIEERLVACARPVPGALEALESLARRYRLYLVSGMGEGPLGRIVEAFGLADRFAAVISTDGCDRPERQKSSGWHLRRLCAEQGMAYGETLCVGDARSDIEMAGRCGIPVVVVLTGALDRESALRLGAYRVLPSLALLPGFLLEADGFSRPGAE